MYVDTCPVKAHSALLKRRAQRGCSAGNARKRLSSNCTYTRRKNKSGLNVFSIPSHAPATTEGQRDFYKVSSESFFVLLPMLFLVPQLLSSAPLSLLTWPTLYPLPPQAPYNHTNPPCFSTQSQRSHCWPHNPLPTSIPPPPSKALTSKPGLCLYPAESHELTQAPSNTHTHS